MELVLATKNKGKLEEIKRFIFEKGLDINVLSLDNFPEIEDIPEPYNSFEENALHKAQMVSLKTNFLTLSDDSGLEVDALGGKPGVFSARFAGENATDEENNNKLLKLMKDIPFEKRGAQFRCVMVLYSPSGDYLLTQGIWKGKIATYPQGDKGFGYDPIFFDEKLSKTAACLDIDTKNRLSHRGKALRKLMNLIGPFVDTINRGE